MEKALRSFWEEVLSFGVAAAWTLSPSRLGPRLPASRRANPIKSWGTGSLQPLSVQSNFKVNRSCARGPLPRVARQPWPRSCTTRSSPGRARRRGCRSGGSRSWSWCRCPGALTATSTSGMRTWCCTRARRAAASATACTSGWVRVAGAPPGRPRFGRGEAAGS